VLYSLAYRYLRRQEESEDAVQEIFLRAYDALPRFRRDRRFYSWLYTIGVNYLRNARDKRARRGSDAQLPYEDRVATGDIRTPLADPERELDRREAETLLHRAIDLLPAAQREVLMLRQFEELSVAQVAEVLDMPEGTVKTNLHRARRSLAKLMTEEDV
ncbi:MAG: RNA polymerase sigma factor, partial [Spirochaetota bacterium]